LPSNSDGEKFSGSFGISETTRHECFCPSRARWGKLQRNRRYFRRLGFALRSLVGKTSAEPTVFPAAWFCPPDEWGSAMGKNLAKPTVFPAALGTGVFALR